MANKRNKNVDTTYLSIDKAEERGFIHRDYIAHCLRWSHVIKRLMERAQYKTARVLDIGCGREVPLAKTLYSSKMVVERYFGVDVGPIPDGSLEPFSSGVFPVKVWERTDFREISLEDLEGMPANWVTCFEVLEHVEPRHMLDILDNVQRLLSDGGTAFFSTPCWNRTDCAANHVNEMTYSALGAVFEAADFEVEKVYGTFASIRDYEHMMPHFTEITELPLRHVFNLLREYYDTNFLSCIFAPIFPAQSRNCIWELKKRNRNKKYPALKDCNPPWGSSEKWKEMAR
jgi:2-polyprenyl-3-methyl-5-hydroxy-6-metoxy-1,4-benzoquinol methylase